MNQKKRKNILPYAVLLAGVLAMLLLEWKKQVLYVAVPDGEMWYQIMSRMAAAFVCMALMCRFSLSHLIFPKKWGGRELAVILPCFAIAINNFPFLSVIGGDASIHAPVGKWLLYGLLCLSVGLFEEVAFRGCVFVICLERTKASRAPMLRVLFASVLSSAVFGLVHLMNLFAGASVESVLLQVGYSFLIGGMCSIMLVKTANVWYSVWLHAIYNFAGGVVPQLGSGTIWTTPTVILTVAISIVIVVYVFFLLFKISKEEIAKTVNGI